MSKVSATKTPNSKAYKHNTGSSIANPFDSDSDTEQNTRSTRASSAPAINRPHHRGNQSYQNGYQGRGSSSSSHSALAVGNNGYKGGFNEPAGYETQSLQELENMQVKKLLGSLGGLFSKTWKPKKTREIRGPVISRDDSFIRRGNHMEQRQKLGLESPRSRSNPRQFLSEPSTALERIEIEKVKQDDALSDLSNILGELKAMAVDMGSEIDRQNKALDNMQDDVEEINYRVRGANQRARRLLGR
ncbi:hypothetical protein HPP92_018908 [Vanilla planifolia]|uniref:t-SNARE coiled-coil homology domain-containing protein n=1 Tax=Vanilla planifolia TaxID=51239 RepID=A0A835Q807_VANPL|nr:hypothetical protein HPP92_018908 [Vanilla planifolia]